MSTLFFANDNNQSQKLYRLRKKNKIRRLYHGIYTDNFSDPIEKIIQSKWLKIVAHIVPNGLLSFKTALELKPIPVGNNQAIVFVTSSYNKTIILPGLIIKVLQGNNRHYSEQILPNLSRTNIARTLLENLRPVKIQKYKTIKTIGQDGVENYLAKELRMRGEPGLNQIRDEAKKIAKDLGYDTEYKTLTQLISALLSTHPENDFLQTQYAKAIAAKNPYDPNRLVLFENLYIYLKKNKLIERPYKFNKSSFKNIAFFESYFSNFIEGTEFIIEEVEEIVFRGIEIYNRHADSHDILAHFNLSNDFFDISKTPENPEEFLNLLTRRHATLMQERPEKNPGKFKTKPNKAGSTYFVKPDEVIGTLQKSFEFYKLLEPGLARALFIHFVISEVHPFTDGNGRIARIMLNSELVNDNKYKIIMPTVHRDNYLNGLKLATRGQGFYLYCKVMDQAQAYTQSINWLNYGDAREKIEIDCADQIPDEGLPIFNRAIRMLSLSDLSN